MKRQPKRRPIPGPVREPFDPGVRLDPAIDVFHSQPLPGAVVYDLTAPGVKLGLVIEVGEDKYNHSFRLNLDLGEVKLARRPSRRSRLVVAFALPILPNAKIRRY